ncbi:MAG: AAA family ATPase [Candidatus Hatepunaea meridiana]|nr:AAA family ATPase [Candidatus Hatepunaea meridiana]
MYKEFKIKNFKCFSDFSIDSFERVNLIAGENCVGKTAFLEALFIHCGAYNPGLTFRIDSLRGVKVVNFDNFKETPWDHLFNDFNTSKGIVLFGKTDNKEERELHLRIVDKQNELKEIINTKDTDIEETESASISTNIIKTLELMSKDEKKREHISFIFIHKQKIHNINVIAPPFPAQYVSNRIQISDEIINYFSAIEKVGKQRIVLNVIKVVEKRLKRLTNITIGKDTVIYGDIGLNQLVPISYMGSGITRLLSVILAIANNNNGIVLIDEIENGFHHGIMKKVWQAIGKAARDFNVQVFAVTHSRECVVAAHQAFSENDVYDFRYHRLDKIKGVIKAVNYNQEIMQAAIEANFEVR